MPFGKYRGHRLSEIPADYFLWVLNEASAAKPWLREAIEEELNRRDDPGAGAYEAPADLRGTIKTWFAGLARDYHPDRIGGDGREMKALNEAHERLRKLVGIS
jgi:hypothetical protein